MRTLFTTASIAFALLLLPLLPGCPESAPGDRLCDVAGVEFTCGIARDACLDALAADDAFHVDHVFTDWAVVVQDGRCLLDVRDLGSGNVAFDDDLFEDDHVVVFDVGEVVGPV